MTLRFPSRVGSLEDFGAVAEESVGMIGAATPAVDKVKVIGHSSEERDALLFLDPVWTDHYTSLYTDNVFPHKLLELLSIAFDAAYVDIYGTVTRRHIKNVFKACATVAEELERNSAA